MADNSIALQIRPPEINQLNIAAPMMAAAQFQHAMSQNDLARFGMMKAQRDDANRQSALGLISSSDPNAAMKALSLDPEIGLKIQEFRSKARENDFNALKRKVEVFGQVGRGVMSAPPGERSMLYVQQRASLIQQGLAKEEDIPPTYSEGWLRNAINQNASAEQYFNQPMVMGPGGLSPASSVGSPGGAAPAAPGAPAPRPLGNLTGAPGLTGGVVDRITGVESGGNPNARNPRSSAMGLGQFIGSTWLNTIKTTRPDLAAGKSDAELLAMRSDPQLSRDMTAAYAAQNGKVLSDAGFQPTPGNTYLAHFAGPQGATAILGAAPNTPVAQILGAKVMQANPFLRGMTASQLTAWADRKMAGAEMSPGMTANAPGGMVAPTNTAALAPGMMAPTPMGAAPFMFGAQPPQPAPAPPPQGVAPIPGQPGSLAQPVFKKGVPYTDGAPPGMQWMVGPDGKWTQANVPGSEDADKELVKVNDPNSPAGESFVKRSQIKPGMVPAKDATEGQANARLYASRMAASEKIIQQFEQAGTSLKDRALGSIAEGGSFTPTIVAGLANKGVSGNFQQLRQAERDFVNAVLRRESGAVISPGEFANAVQQYFPQPGDSAAVIAQKRSNRQLAVEGITRASQPGFGAAGPTGTPPGGAVSAPARAAAPSAAPNLPPPPPGFVLVQ